MSTPLMSTPLMSTPLMSNVLAALQFEPEIRGSLILLLAILILPGSVYLILSTNLGARLGFLVVIAGLSGFLALLALVWTIFGQGPRGREPVWKVEAVLSGELGATARPPLGEFPRGWRKLADDDPQKAEAQAAVDEALTKGEESSTLGFSSTGDYVVLPGHGYDRGGKKTQILGLTLSHEPHYAVIQVQQNKNKGVEAEPGKAPPKAEPDTTKPVITALVVRDLGALRLPPFLVFLSALTIFGVLVSVLHRRDKLAMAARAALPAGNA
jgi:hypothetical protein